MVLVAEKRAASAKTRAENHNATRLLQSSRLRARGATLATGHGINHIKLRTGSPHLRVESGFWQLVPCAKGASYTSPGLLRVSATLGM
jgi:hypothetical protein